PMQNGYVESFNGRMRDELLNESLFFGLDHARSAIAEWADDYNHFRPHSSLGYKTPADFAGTIAATGSNAAQDESFAFPPVAPTAPLGVFKTAGALVAAG
ncbi:transposase, partial [Rhizobium laguerreae]